MRKRSVCAVALMCTGAAAMTWSSTDSGAQAPSDPVRGGTLTYLAAADVDYLDPGQTYYTFGFTVTNAVHRSLYAFAPSDAATPVPDLAAAAPEISADRKTVTVKLKTGVRFAPPVNREVEAKDVKYAFERAFSSRVPSGYAMAYFGALQGAPKRPAKGIPSIAGVQAVDAHTLRLRLKRPVGQTVAAGLVLPITAPVPREYAKRFDKRRPSTYDRRPAFSGPYMVTKRSPGKVIRLARNPNWDPATDFRPAYLDAITIDEGNDDLSAAGRRALGGSHLVCCDSGQPPLGVLKSAPADQVAGAPSGGTRWISLNTRIKPFDNRAVRRAVVAGMNRSALQATRGGAVTGTVATHFLPPGIPGFAEAGGDAGFADLDFMANPAGDQAVSQRYFKQAGFKAGKYTGRKRLKVIATKADPGRRTAEAAVRQLRRMGFKLRVRYVDQDSYYTRYCGKPRAQIAICANVGWFRDYADPETLLRPTFSSAEIRRAGNVNWSELRVGGIDRAMRRAAALPFGPGRNAAWAAIDKQITAEAPGIPYSWDTSFGLRSTDVAGAFNAATGTWDLSFTSVN